LRGVVATKSTSIAGVVIAGVLAQVEDIVPLVGSRRRDQLTEAMSALNVELTRSDLAAIERAVPKDPRAQPPASATRYGPEQMAQLDNERS
jgi:aryl-alcohol dehydrogenase-like predicted oxidoreductase